ncbi:hypothetical protein C41B8_04251 [Salinisphaera hydrothermalis C41B8]|uniref:Uncharacterized protein n=1 Tax=Salinisphaera hydrothermalis (strain C41B8) TaxID=1304275 RepID=A0A084INX8_SALHC|nr:hypothetical protein C41B8_04251 [Salinisphaera hydrothermalis C41B8]
MGGRAVGLPAGAIGFPAELKDTERGGLWAPGDNNDSWLTAHLFHLRNLRINQETGSHDPE